MLHKTSTSIRNYPRPTKGCNWGHKLSKQEDLSQRNGTYIELFDKTKIIEYVNKRVKDWRLPWWLGPLNFIILQWFGIRLTKVIHASLLDTHMDHYKIMYRWPLAGWKWK